MFTKKNFHPKNFHPKIFTQKNFHPKNFHPKMFTQIVRLSFVDLRWAQLYVSLVSLTVWWVSFTTLTYCPIKEGQDYFVTLDLLPLYDSNILNNKIHLVKRRAYTGIQNDWSPRALDQGGELVSTGCEAIGRQVIRRKREHHPLTIAVAQTTSGNTIPVTQSHLMTSHWCLHS